MRILLITLVFTLSMVCTNSHNCNRWDVVCRIWHQAFGNEDETTREDFKPVPVDNCYCVPIYKCYQDDISTQLQCRNRANYVDRNLVCCRNPVRLTTVQPPPRRSTLRPNHWTWSSWPWGPATRPSTQGPPKTSTKIPGRNPPSTPTTQVPPLTSSSQTPITNSPTQIGPASSHPQPQDTSQADHSTHNDCANTCMPLSDCYDEDFENNNHHRQGSCPNSNHVCCHGLVQKVTTPPLQPPKPSQTPTQGQTLGSAQRPQRPSPPSKNKGCICTPFFKCYDEETSSNLTSLVNDRTFIPNTEESCSDPNDICCYNLVKAVAQSVIDSLSEDCTGSCISILECPYLKNKLNEARGENQAAIQELRSSVCSSTNGVLHVCCPPEAEGGDNKFGVKWPKT